MSNIVPSLFPTGALAFVTPGMASDHYIRDIPRCCPESSYYIQGSTELLEITGDVATFANRMHFSMDEFLDGFDFAATRYHPEFPGYTFAASHAMREHYKCWYNTHATDMERAFVGMGLIGCTSYQFQEFWWELSDFATAAQIASKTLPENGPTKEAVRDFLQEDTRLNYWVSCLEESYAQAVKAISLVKIDDLNQYGAEREAIDRRVFEDTHQIGHKSKPITKNTTNRTRSALKKGLKMLSGLIGPDKVRSFVSGDGFTLEGDLFNYKVEKSISLISHTHNHSGGHIPYTLIIMSKDNERLGMACVYFKNTPVIDQIIALAFFVKGGEEETLIKTANIFSRTEKYAENETIKLLKPSDNIRITHDGAGNLLEDIPYITSPLQDDTHATQIVPWRIRNKQMITEILSERSRIPLPYLSQLIAINEQPYGTINDVIDQTPYLLE